MLLPRCDLLTCALQPGGWHMKSFIWGAALCAALSSFAVAAQAAGDPFQPGFYLSGGSEVWVPTYRYGLSAIAPNVLYGGEIDAGWRFNRYYSVEAGYSAAAGSATVAATVQALSIDAYGYLPLGRGSHFALFGTAGVSELRGTAIGTGYGYYVISTSYAFGGRFGAGAQFQFNQNWGLRAGARYQFADFSSASGALVTSVQVVWHP